jgi:protein ImuA
MPGTKADIILRLQKEILPLQGFKQSSNEAVLDIGFGPLKHAFPNNSFPLGAIHEFVSIGAEDASASTGFIAGVLSKLMKSGGAVLWIGSSRTLFPPALASFGIDPDKIIFIDLQNQRDVLWAMEEALKCDALAAVVGEMQELSFTVSRRFQLAVEQSRVTGFILRRNPRNLTTTACIARWKITSLPGTFDNDMPGVGFPHWNVELLKIRNGKPGTWQLKWIGKKFRHVPSIASIKSLEEHQKKAG